MDWLGMAMFAGALVLLSLGFPVAFSLGGVAILFAAISVRQLARLTLPSLMRCPAVSLALCPTIRC